MKLRTKMSLAFGTVFIACAAAALMVTLTLERSAGKIVEIAKGVQPVSVNLLQIRDSHQKLHALVLRSLASPHDPDIPRQQRTISDRLNMVRGGLDKLFDALGDVQQRVPYVEPVLLEKLHRHSAETMRLADAVIATAPEDLPRAQDLFRGPYQESHAALALARNALKAQVDLLQKRQLSGLADAFRDNIRTVAFVFVLVLLAIFVITIASNRSIVSRVRCLREATERFAEGHLSARASLKARDEFGDLAAAFNRMADTVQGQTAALRSHAKLLQKRVEERTEQLRAKARELQQKNRQLGNANRQLSRLDEMKNDFIATASHELRTPLTAMHGSLELLLKGQFSELSGDAIQLIHLCRRNVKRLIDLVGELLDLSLIDHGKLRLKPERVDLRRLAQEVIDGFEMQARRRSITMHNDIPQEIALWADTSKTARVLANLLSNAVKFTSEGSVHITADADGDEASVKIVDTGVGIAPEAISSIFDRFCQADNPETRDAGGVGLGLAITKLLIERQGGKISVQSTPGIGSTFTFTLPRFTGQEAPTPALASQPS